MDKVNAVTSIDEIEDARHNEKTPVSERQESVGTIIRRDKKVVFWCLFFAFSTIGW